MNILRLIKPRIVSSERGAALLVVLIFAVVSFIAVSAFLLGSQMLMRQGFVSTRTLQPLLTARSGAWWVISQVEGGPRPDTLRIISTLDQHFNADLIRGSNATTTTDPEMPILGGKACDINPFSSTDFGSAEVALTPAAGFMAVVSTGRFRDISRTVIARLGGRPIVSPDTVLYLPPATADIRGNVPPKRQRGTFNGGNEIDRKLMNQIVGYYQLALQPDSGTTLADLPLIVRTADDIARIPAIVNGPLLIDARAGRLDWHGSGTIRVFGDLQITGDARIDGITFLTTGEIKIYDDARLSKVTLVTLSNFFLGDRAELCGDALVYGTATVYGNASMTRRSSLVALGRPTKQSTAQNQQGQKSPSFSIVLAERCSIDATVVAPQNAGSIRTDHEVGIRGVLFAFTLSHSGALEGTAKTGLLADYSDPHHVQTNFVSGRFRPLATISSYPIPIFLGKPTVVGWSED